MILLLAFVGLIVTHFSTKYQALGFVGIKICSVGIIDDSLGIFYATKEAIPYWIGQFNMLSERIKINKWSNGNKVEYMDLKILKG